MSAVPSVVNHQVGSPRVLAWMTESDLAGVIRIENAVYSHPWTQQNFSDSLHAGYSCRVARLGGLLIGYFVISAVAGEAHLLNLSIAPEAQREGHGRALLGESVALARSLGAERLFLEVRPSNPPAIALYASAGFEQLAVRRGYYPAHGGREDALIFSLRL